MIVLVDQDGPLSGFDNRFYADCETNGYTVDCTLETQTSRWATDHIPDENQRKRARAMIEAEGWFEDLPVVEGAQEGMEALASAIGIENIWICTKPLESNPTCRDAKAAWIKQHLGKEWVKRLIITPDKSMVRGTILLDDAPHIDWLPKALWTPVIFAAPWNDKGSKWEGLPRFTWADGTAALLAAGVAE